MDSKLPHIGTTIFTVMSQLAQECGAINLSQGFPSFEPPAALLDRVSHHIRNGANQYAPMAGVPGLKQAIADKVLGIYGRAVDAESDITISSGATEGLFSAIMATVRTGDEAIVFDPAYDSYDPAITLAGGKTIHIPLLSTGTDFRVDWDRLRDAINEKTRLIILNFPHNPTGAILSQEELDVFAGIVRDRDLYVLSDEVYEHIVFGGRKHQSLLRHEELAQRSFVISSFGKTFHATGWKVGYCIAPKNLTTEFRKVHQFNCFAVATPLQHAFADYMLREPRGFEALPGFYEEKRDCFNNQLLESRFRYSPARSTFFQLLDYSSISDEADTEFAERLTRQIGVAAIPVSVFYQAPPQQKLLRFCFAKDDDTLREAAEKLCNL